LHRITPGRLEHARAQFAEHFKAFPTPRVAVMLGGSTNKYRFTKTAMSRVIDDLNNVLENSAGSLLITPSRRTGAENLAMLKHAFAHDPRVYIYDNTGENPYMGLLALADYLIVSNDSVNMMSEARATGKPLYILPLMGHKNTKPERFSQRLMREGSARKTGRGLENWSYAIHDDMAQLAIEIRRILPI
jgi:mitochondrial fission protein ELM1